MPATARRWDIFCAVVDNYGDAGVCWRLARQLAGEHGLAVRLFVDALPALARIAPAIDPLRAEQIAHGVRICRWGGPDGVPAGIGTASVRQNAARAAASARNASRRAMRSPSRSRPPLDGVNPGKKK